MTLSTTGAPNAGVVYLAMIGKDAAGNSVVEQGSGVLLSGDEVLTAAHLVYNPDGSLRTAGTAAVGYDAGAAAAISKVDGVQVGAFQDYASIAGMGADFAVVHLSTAVKDGTVFSVGSAPASGVFQVSGYPVGTAGRLDTKTETLSVASGTQVYQGETLDDGATNPAGSSGGSIYQVVNGAPTAYGVISAMSTADTTKGFFKALTAADAAQIEAWVAGADGGAAGASQGPSSSPVLSSGPVLAHSAPGFDTDVADLLAGDADGFSGGTHAAMVDVAAAITRACRDGGSFDAMAQDAASILGATSPNAGRDVAYLAGFLSGTTGSWLSSLKQTANAILGGSVFDAASRAFASAGRQEGLGIGAVNTAATIDPASATLAHALADASHAVDGVASIGAVGPHHVATALAGAHHGHLGKLFS